MNDHPRPPAMALKVKCKCCSTPVIIENDAVMTHAIRHGIKPKRLSTMRQARAFRLGVEVGKRLAQCGRV